MHEAVVAAVRAHVPAISEGLELPFEVAEEDELGAQELPAAHGSESAERQQAHFVHQKPGVRQRGVQVEQVRNGLAADHAARRVRVRADADLLLHALQHCLDLLEQHGLAASRRAKAEHA